MASVGESSRQAEHRHSPVFGLITPPQESQRIRARIARITV